MYAKIFSQIYDGTLCTSGPWEALVTFQQLLILADQDGVVDMTAAAIARRTTIPIDIITRGIAALMEPDPESRTPDEGGRRLVPLADGRSWGWRIVNYVKYRQIKREEDRREYHREYWHKRKLKASTATQQAQPNQPIAEAEAEAEAEAKVKKTARKVATATSLACPAGVNAQVWSDWFALRKAKRAPVTATVLKSAQEEADKAGMSLEAFLTVWCRRGSQGLEAAWLRPDERGQGVESFRERDARAAAEKVKAWTGGLCHDRKALGEAPRTPLPFERGYVKPDDTIEGEAHEQHRIAG